MKVCILLVTMIYLVGASGCEGGKCDAGDESSMMQDKNAFTPSQMRMVHTRDETSLVQLSASLYQQSSIRANTSQDSSHIDVEAQTSLEATQKKCPTKKKCCCFVTGQAKEVELHDDGTNEWHYMAFFHGQEVEETEYGVGASLKHYFVEGNKNACKKHDDGAWQARAAKEKEFQDDEYKGRLKGHDENGPVVRYVGKFCLNDQVAHEEKPEPGFGSTCDATQCEAKYFMSFKGHSSKGKWIDDPKQLLNLHEYWGMREAVYEQSQYDPYTPQMADDSPTLR